MMARDPLGLVVTAVRNWYLNRNLATHPAELTVTWTRDPSGWRVSAQGVWR